MEKAKGYEGVCVFLETAGSGRTLISAAVPNRDNNSIPSSVSNSPGTSKKTGNEVSIC